MFREALTYPIRAGEETLLAGLALAVAAGLFARLGVLAVLAVPPLLVLAGYALAVIRATAEGADAPPRFGDLRALAGDGARAMAIAAGYLLVPGVALGVTLGGASAGRRPETLTTTVFVFGAGTVLLFLAAGLAYLLPAALASTAERGSLRAALDSSALRTAATDGRYFVAWTFAAILVAVVATAGVALAGLGRIGQVAALAAAVYALVAVARLAGLGARAAGGVDRR